MALRGRRHTQCHSRAAPPQLEAPPEQPAVGDAVGPRGALEGTPPELRFEGRRGASRECQTLGEPARSSGMSITCLAGHQLCDIPGL